MFSLAEALYVSATIYRRVTQRFMFAPLLDASNLQLKQAARKRD